MDLILWRHAEAVEQRAGQDDLERALTPKGERQAQRMARWLQHQLPQTTRVLASPALRAQQTAQALDRKIRTVAAIAPDATVQSLLEAARWPTCREPVLVVGHQPTLGLAAAWLMAGVAQPWSIRKGGIWWLRSREEEVTLVAVLSPEQL